MNKDLLKKRPQEKEAWAANFGTTTEAQEQTIRQRYQHVIDTKDQKITSLKESCTSSEHGRLCAQGEISGDQIFICPAFAESERCASGPTMLHEMIHNAGAKDDFDRDGTYPPSNPENNAYSYEYFILDTKKRYGAAPSLEKPEAELPFFDE
jgi:hypothetical protein